MAHKTARPEIPDLGTRPGFLIRRLHQIHVALFAEECAAFDMTPVQYSIMTVLRRSPHLSQAGLGQWVGVDRATLANVVARIEAKGLLFRSSGAADARIKLVRLTPSGRALLRRMDGPALRAHDRTTASLTGAERQQFLAALEKLVDAGNQYGPVTAKLCDLAI